MLAHVIAGDARGIGGQVQPGDRRAAPVDDRHGNRAQAPFQLLVDDGKALLAVAPDPVDQRCAR